MFAKRCWCPHQSVCALDSELGRKPRPLKNSWLSPLRRSQVMLGAEMLGQCGEQNVPPLVPHGLRLGLDQADLNLSRLPSILLKEFPDQLPSQLVIVGRDYVGENRQAHRLIPRHRAALLADARAPGSKMSMFAIDV